MNFTDNSPETVCNLDECLPKADDSVLDCNYGYNIYNDDETYDNDEIDSHEEAPDDDGDYADQEDGVIDFEDTCVDVHCYSNGCYYDDNGDDYYEDFGDEGYHYYSD